MSDFLPIARVQIEEEDLKEVADTLRSGWLTTGPRTKEFEDRCREYIGCRHAVALNSGTAALHLALWSLGVGPGDEVITTPLTFAATVNSILMVGATPVLADVEPETLNISAESAAARVTSRTKAIMVVHYAGAAVDMDAFSSLAEERGLLLAEDAAHAMGAKVNGARVGANSLAACFSFHPVKNMTTGEGGLLVTNDDEVERVARLRSWHGIDKSALNRYHAKGKWAYEVQDLGYKYNMFDLQAAIGLHQLDRLEEANRERREIAAEYDSAFGRLEGVRIPPGKGEDDARHLYWLVLDPNRYDRDRFISSLTERGIGAAVHYIPIHFHPYYRERFGWQEGMCPNAEAAFRGLVSIPLFHGMKPAERTRVMEEVPAALSAARI